MKTIQILIGFSLFTLSISNAFACESGVKEYIVSGTRGGINYVAVKVDWENSWVWLKKSNGSYHPLDGFNPADPDPVLTESIVEDLIQREVTTNC